MLEFSQETRDPEFGVAVRGQFRLLRGMSVVRVPRASQRLLAFLALQGRIIERAALAGALWPEASEPHAYSSLRAALTRLQRTARMAVTAAAGAAARGEPLRENGEVLTIPDFFWVAPSYTRETVEAAVRLEPGVERLVTLSAPGRVGLAIYDAQGGDRISYVFADGSVERGRALLYGPDGERVGDPIWIAEPFAFGDPRPMPLDGTYTLATYTILIEPDFDDVMSVMLALVAPMSFAATVDGAPVNVTTTRVVCSADRSSHVPADH